jgi:hypothetical protein
MHGQIKHTHANACHVVMSLECVSARPADMACIHGINDQNEGKHDMLNVTASAGLRACQPGQVNGQVEYRLDLLLACWTLDIST